jgi:pyruvate dehydrogenase E2 component (dihydrolipoamide acetyltransferase)
MEVDMSEAKRFREKLMSEAKEGTKFTVTYTDIIVKAVAMALKKNPVINSSLEGDSIKIFKDVNVGIAVAVEDGLIVPVIHNADQMSIEEIASRRKHLVEKAARRELSVDEVSGGTFTVSNLGMFDVDAFSPIINPPQSAILGVGAIKNKALVVDGQVVARPAMTLSLVFDHRVFDGAQAAAFLKDIKETLEKPFAYMNIG